MAYVSGFEHDLFISYSHVDNLAGPGESAWVDQFHKKLEIRLAQRVGRVGQVKIWRDPRIDGSCVFDDTIRSAVDGAALFVALTSNGYLQSDYCQQELRQFHEKVGREPEGLQLGDRARIVNVLLNNIPYDYWPPEFPRTTGHPLHDAGDSDALGYPLDLEDRSSRPPLRRLVDAIYQTLRVFREAAADRDGPSPRDDKTHGDHPKVFFADVADTMRSTRKRVVAELKRKGIDVVSGIPPPYAAEEHRASVATALEGALLSVHLLDRFFGREVEGESAASYPQAQVELARVRAVPRLIWVPKDLEFATVEEERQRNLLGELENAGQGETGYDFIRGSVPTLAPQILEKLGELRPPKRGNGAHPAVLLDTHIKDQLYALELSRYLLQQNIQPYINPLEDDPTKNMEILEARLRQVSALMVLFGDVNEQWVRERLAAALQLSVTKNLPVRSFSVFFAPPEKDERVLHFDLGPLDVKLVDNSHSGAPDPAALAPVLEAIAAP